MTHDINLLRYVAPVEDHHKIRVLGLKGGALHMDSSLAAPGLVSDLSSLFGVQMERVQQGDSWVLIPAGGPKGDGS